MPTKPCTGQGRWRGRTLGRQLICAVLLSLPTVATAGAHNPDAITQEVPLPESAGPINKARGSDYEVDVTKVVKQSTLDGKLLYEIDYRYSFRGRQTLYITGLGSVRPNGRFSYLTEDPHLVFRESPSGPILVDVSLSPTIRTMAPPVETEPPGDDKFPSTFKSGTWPVRTSFAEAAVTVIQRHFYGWSPRGTGPVTALVTPFIPLPLPTDRNLRAEVAVRVSQPYDPLNNRFTFRVQVLARDRPRQSDSWSYGTQCEAATITAADALGNKLLQELIDSQRQK